jgi:hypothetical protein
MTSVRYGTSLFKKQEIEELTALLSKFSEQSAIVTSRYIKAPMLPRLHSPLPPTISTSCTSRRHIHSATSLAIAQTRPLSFLFPSPLNLTILPMPHLIHQPTATTPIRDKSSK